MLNMGFSVESNLGSSPPLITMLKKKGKRILENADEIVDHLKQRFPASNFTTLEGDAVAVMSMREQVWILIALFGSGQRFL